MRYLKIIVLSIALVCSYIGSLSAQEMRYEKVDFKIKQVKIATNVWNDTILNLKVDFFSREGSQLSLEGSGTLSLCYCYCDSIWDAWPEEIGGDGIPGTATIGYSSSGNSHRLISVASQR